jgi:hypothetical protein
MPLIPLDIPAGVHRNGTDLQSLGRWRDASLVRWIDGTMQPVKGWRERSSTAADATPRGMVSWSDNSSNRWYTVGTYNKLYVYGGSAGTRFDITPIGLTAGREDALAFTGYGGNAYGAFAYGVARPDTSRIQPATSWALQLWGEYLLASNADDGKVYEWQLSTGTPAAQVANAPVDNKSIVVTEERFLMCLGAGGNPRKVQWSDREDNTTWTPAATNEAGDLELATLGEIMAGVPVRGQTLILTTRDAHVANYIGPPYVYGIEQVGSSCGLASSLAYASVDAGCFWMGTHSFHAYAGGQVQDVPCDVSDYVFNDMNRSQISKAFAVANSTFGEVWWFYPSSDSTENNRYVAYNYIENTWAIGLLARSAGVDAGAISQPLMASPDDNKIYEHEVGYAYSGAMPFAETGPVMIGTGENVVSVTEMLPDEKTQGDVSATFKTRFYPNGTERSYGPFSLSAPTSLRFTGRQMRMRVTGQTLGDWRVGIMRLDARTRGRR